MTSLTWWDYVLIFGSSFCTAVLVVCGVVLLLDRERGK